MTERTAGDCRECRAVRHQLAMVVPAGCCPEHGEISVDNAAAYWQARAEKAEAERDKLRSLLVHIECKSCGLSPVTSPYWEWAYGKGYRNGHLIPGPVPDLCGPVEFVARLPDLEARRD